MNEKLHFKTVDDYNKMVGAETLHPLVSIIDFSQLESYIEPNTVERDLALLHFDLYAIYFKESVYGDVYYGYNKYDYKEGTMVFIAPGQNIRIERRDNEVKRTGWVLIFHPDFISGSFLARNMVGYSFFSYESNEALHVSECEKEIVFDIFNHIKYEINERIDKHTKQIIIDNLKMLLDYCVRFYDRQFITRENLNKGILNQFKLFLNQYFETDKPQLFGLPSVTSVAKELNLSPNYLGDLVKKESGKTALELIHLKLVSKAKSMIVDTHKSISEIAYELGFDYPQHFTRLFKKQVGISPKDFRNSN